MLAFLGVACAFMGRAKFALCPVHVLLLLSLVCLQGLLPGGSLVAMVGRGCGVPGSAWGWLGPSTGLIVTERQVKKRERQVKSRDGPRGLIVTESQVKSSRPVGVPVLGDGCYAHRGWERFPPCMTYSS